MGWLFGSGLSGQCTTIDSPRISKRALCMGDFTCRCESPIRTLTPWEHGVGGFDKDSA